MAKEFTVKYQYALNSKDEILNINALSKTDEIRREIYRCISCEKSLRPVLGEVRKKHFRHVVEANCNPETYLHQLAKRLFFQVYTDCLETGSPFSIELYENWVCTSCKDEFGITCELDPKLIKFDLVKLFPNISIETPDGSFIPDILLSNGNGEKLFIEFVVTHVSSEEKRNSGARIIELSLEDEDDLEPIQQKLISQTYFKVEFLNFKKISRTRCSFPSCHKKLFFFLLLYLAWLKAMTMYGDSYADEGYDNDDTDVAAYNREPPVPPGLKKLSPPLQNFVQIFEIDPFLVQAAAEESPDPKKALTVDYRELIGRLPRDECDDFLARLAEGDPGAGLALRKPLSAFLPQERPQPAGRRTIQRLL